MPIDFPIMPRSHRPSIDEKRAARRERRRRPREQEVAHANEFATPPADDPLAVSFGSYFDSPNGKAKPDRGKRHWTERWRANMRVERWTNAKAAFISYLTGRGYTAPEIERILGDGTSAATIRGQWRRWGLPIPEQQGKRCTIVPVALPLSIRTKLSVRAREAGIRPNEFLHRVITCIVTDDLYRAVVDDRFDPKPTRRKSEEIGTQESA